MKTLADALYAACTNPAKQLIGHHDVAETRRIGAGLKTQIRSARKYFVDADAVAAAVELGQQHPDLLLQTLFRARAPFATTWLDWDNNAACEAAGLPDAERPARVGVLIERLDDEEPLFRMTVYASPEEGTGGRMILPKTSTIYHLTKPINDFVGEGDIARIASITGFPRAGLDFLPLGSVYVKGASEEIDPEVLEFRRDRCREFTRHARVVFSPQLGPMMRQIAKQEGVFSGGAGYALMQSMLRDNVLEEAGTLRNVVSLLALINARDYVESDALIRSGRDRLVSGKVVPYLDHWMVKLKLPRKLVLNRTIKGLADALPRRRHEVTGHWKHTRTNADVSCDHAYVDETPKRQVCALCGGKRWFVNEFMRGDARLGIVTKDRLVTLD